ncbi:MAG: hypothetical protein JO327_00455 [Nitrososphaeraceae archaeon]|nr:hypothetical protein [Nitrososphaeraceae archaeon]
MKERICLRSWAGLKDAAKTLRKRKVSSKGEVEYISHDRELEFEEIDRNAMHDEIYRVAVEVAPIHEINKVVKNRH